MFNAQKSNPSKGDWYVTVTDDFKLIGEDINDFGEQRIKSMNEINYKKRRRKLEQQH